MKTNPIKNLKPLDAEHQRKIEELNRKAKENRVRSERSSLRDESWDTLVYTAIICFVQMAYVSSLLTIRRNSQSLTSVAKS